MSFDQLPSPPDPETYINPQSVGDISRMPVPPRKLFEREVSYWRGSVHPEGTIAFHCAESVAQEIGHILGIYPNLMLACQRMTELSEDLQHNTYSLMRKEAGVLALSRLIRELSLTGIAGEKELYSATQVTHVFDVPVLRELGNAALHIVHSNAEDLFEAVPGEAESAWFEGTSVFVEVVRPARPSESLVRDHLAGNAKVFRQTHVSAIPRLKRTVWQSGAGLPVRPPERRRRSKQRDTIATTPELPAEFRLPKAERDTFNTINHSLINGRSDQQAGWSVEGTTKEAAKNSLGILRWLSSRLPPGSDTEPEALTDQLHTIPAPLLRDSLTALLLNRDKTPKWPDLVRMLRDQWPRQHTPVDWDAVHGVLQATQSRLEN